MTMPQTSSHFSSGSSLRISPMPVSSPLTAIPHFDNNGLDPAQVSLNRLQQIIGLLDSTLRLPNTPRAFAVYLLGLVIVFAGAFLHVLVAAQIMQAEFTLSQLREEYRAIEQQNGDIIFQIAYDNNMERLFARVEALGYVPVQEREYIFVPNEAAAAAPAAVSPQATIADAAAKSVATERIASESADTAHVLAATSTSLAAGSGWGGQFERWEEFWYSTWRAATGRAPLAPDTPTSSVQTSHADPNFWAVWWEEASAQGSKLLDQMRGN